MFSQSINGAQASTTLYSIVMTCQSSLRCKYLRLNSNQSFVYQAVDLRQIDTAHPPNLVRDVPYGKAWQ